MNERLRTGEGDEPSSRPALLILIPVYDDWEAVSALLVALDRTVADAGIRPTVLLVDDGSTKPADKKIGAHAYVNIESIHVVALRRNVGHQRAIAIALAYVYDHLRPDAVLIMDGDGEDAPEDVPRLIQRLRESDGNRVIFAERTRRSESLTFQMFYGLYRFAHLLLTGIPVRVGNFSIVPSGHLERLVVVSELWNHYAAAVFKSRVPRDTISTERAQRLGGQSTMNFVALVGHGLSALSVHAELIGVRLLVVTAGVVAVVLALLTAVVATRLFTTLAIPGWATTAVGLLLVIVLQAAAFAVFFVFLILHGRSQPLFIPLRDYPYFVRSQQILFSNTSELTTPAAQIQLANRS